ncbi:MAG TPA: efflux RND transporter periplasmic adaptor subunit [Acetobacteraceae bacterium]|nr:efflux RND transporter periplasmic adaptor subunit [Acetobacteraceae bacterium]
MIRRMVVMLVALGVVLGGYFGFQQFKAKMIHQFLASMANPPQTVSTVTATTQTWQPAVEAVGSLRAVNGAALSLEVGGVVDQIGFQSGEDVQAGQVLLRLRADDDTAKLAALEASASLAQVNYDRDMRQLHAQAVSQSVVDTDNFNLKNARAQAEEQRAELAKKTLRAPFAGHLGIRAVDLGQYLNPGTAVVTLEALDPLFVDFSVPQQALNRVEVGQAVTAKVDTFPGQSFQGKIIAVSPSVDTDSRNVQMRASLPNPDHRLLPGMFATIDIAAGAPQQWITLPQTAITYNPYGSTVYLVEHAGDAGPAQPAGGAAQTGGTAQASGAAQAGGAAPKLVARQVFVTTGETRGDQVAVLTGVKQGDVVVSAGQVKLRNGSTVLINNTVRPSDNPAPTPADH